jgi:hypothetical protein
MGGPRLTQAEIKKTERKTKNIIIIPKNKTIFQP